jgi:hypothetical protein
MLKIFAFIMLSFSGIFLTNRRLDVECIQNLY